MQQTNPEAIVTIVAIVIILTFIGAIVIIALIYYFDRKKRLIKEKEILKATYEKAILQLTIEVQEQTMQTIGADLHDNIGQLLSLISLTLSSVDMEDINKAKQKIGSAHDLTLQSVKELRLLGKLLDGDQLISLGLSEAIAYQIKWIKKSGKFQVVYTEENKIPKHGNHDKDLVLFRILQEVLNNIIKHSYAGRVTIKLGYKASAIDLQVMDNGKGFDVATLPDNQKGMGLLNLQKRAKIVGGEVLITSQPGDGTCIDIHIPYP